MSDAASAISGAVDSVTSGPVAQGVREQTSKASTEFSNLSNSRKTPSNPAATGQPLTHYHSFFSELVSWNNPRASGIAYASIVSLIFAARYLDVLRYVFKLSYMALGVTVVAEIAGKTVLGNGLATQLRPRKYHTVSRETVDKVFGDIHELVNFFVIESQRILFAENIGASALAAVSAFLAYWLVKIVPYWGLAVIATTTTFFVPLIYTTNQELIDEQVKNVSEMVSSQTEQLRAVANEHTSQATGLAKEKMGAYAAMAQQMIGGKGDVDMTPKAKEPALKDSDFPEAPKSDFKASEPTMPEQEPLIAA